MTNTFLQKLSYSHKGFVPGIELPLSRQPQKVQDFYISDMFAKTGMF
jgi:hypothetical protein